MKGAPKDSIRDFERAAALLAAQPMALRLYVGGNTPSSVRALTNIKHLCESRIHGRYVLEVIDVFQQPERARDDQVLAVPTLIKRAPAPVRRLIGDLSDERMVLRALGLDEPSPPSHAKKHAHHKKQPRR